MEPLVGERVKQREVAGLPPPQLGTVIEDKGGKWVEVRWDDGRELPALRHLILGMLA